MVGMPPFSNRRREFLRISSMAMLAAVANPAESTGTEPRATPLAQFAYNDVILNSSRHNEQLQNTKSVLLSLNDDSLMRPFRVMGGLPAPGDDLGGWYVYKPDFDYRTDLVGLCPAGTFGQWVSALSRIYAATGDLAAREKVLRLNRLYAESVRDGYFEKNRFPAYCYDKLVCGLSDAHQFANDPQALAILDKTTDIAVRHLPGYAVEREFSWRPGTDISYTWDESYTLPENLFLAYQRGAGTRYRNLAVKYIDDANYFDPLAADRNTLADKHAYSYVNALNSAMQAYLTLGSKKHLRAAKNGFDMLLGQSFATGGWGPDELLRAPGSGALAKSLTDTHSSFETPCGSYAHFKLTRYLLRVTGDSRYGDSMEKVMYNTVLGAKPLQGDGTAFYYSDYNVKGRKGYSRHKWPCCSGTLPQVAADYHINGYFRSANSLVVNLYVPSQVTWNRAGRRVQLVQRGNYPLDSVVEFEITTETPQTFSLRLRIPHWTQSPGISLNGKRMPMELTPGTFAAVTRTWKNGDRVELELPMPLALIPIDAEHPDTVALVRGPLVLFAVTEKAPQVSRKQLLEARRADAESWDVEASGETVRLTPFTAITDQPYTTYLKCS